MKNEVVVSKSLAETLKKKKNEKEMRATLRRFIILERASKPVKKDGKLVITEQAAKARIILEVYSASLGVYTQVWKDIVDRIKDYPDSIETTLSMLSKNEIKEVNDDESIADLETFVTELNGLLDKAKKLKEEIGKRDEEFKKFADSIAPGSDVATPSEINLDQVEAPADINPQDQKPEDEESKAKIGVEDL